MKKKKEKTPPHTAHYSSSSVIQYPWSTAIPNWFEKTLFTPKVFPVAAELKRVSTHPVWSWCMSSTTFQTNLGSLGLCTLGLRRMSCMEPFDGLFCPRFEQVPFFFSCSGECCNTVLLWTSRSILWIMKLQHLPSLGWGWTDTVIDLYFIFGWTYPLLMHMLKTFTKVSDKESLLTEHINA